MGRPQRTILESRFRDEGEQARTLQAKAYRLADNATNELAQWDKELLPLELADLQAVGFDLGLLGFGEDELAKYLQPVLEGQCDPDEVPAPPDEPTTNPATGGSLGTIVFSAVIPVSPRMWIGC